MSYSDEIAGQLKLPPAQVAAAIGLFDGGNTLPFVARYRKEQTGGLDEEQLRQIQSLLESLRALDERRATVLAAIEAQGKLTPELRAAIEAAASRTELDDLYQPYKQKRRTRASVARERGLEPLAAMILEQFQSVTHSAERLAEPFLGPEVAAVEDALAGARDIVAETVSDHPEVRRLTRERAWRWGAVQAGKIEGAEDPKAVYANYYAFEGRVERLRPHQILALNRGEAEKVLRLKLDVPERDWQGAVATVFRPDRRSPFATHLAQAIADAAERLLLPAIERDVRRSLSELAEAHAITVFAANLRGLLQQPPVPGVIIGLDPGFRTGCKVAAIDRTGAVLATATIYPHEPQRQRDAALKTLIGLIARHDAALVAIGNGTASRETEQLAAELIRSVKSVRYVIVSEAGASVYSASPLARAELPGLDVSLRGAVSIARRLQDPLAELVKIDPQSIGVGMYQHDVDQSKLSQSLAGVVESVVNQVGVDANTASPALLTHVAGIGPKLAEKIVAYRDENGPFPTRAALKKVPGLGPKAFEQAAGFLRIRGGAQPLDASAIHPESYPVAHAVLKRAGLAASDSAAKRQQALESLRAKQPVSELAAELGAGAPTLLDIFEQLLRPGRDPREDVPPPLLRSDVLSMDDLKTGMRLKGTVRNVVDFGAFIDIGVKQDGLLHRTRFPAGAPLAVGEVVEVEIQAIDVERGRISLAWPEGAGR
ncbi:MAG TPA: Tex family protein [Herpetosiphonaceae bacterium]